MDKKTLFLPYFNNKTTLVAPGYYHMYQPYCLIKTSHIIFKLFCNLANPKFNKVIRLMYVVTT
jgi:hypothetical protein